MVSPNQFINYYFSYNTPDVNDLTLHQTYQIDMCSVYQYETESQN